MLPGKRGRKRMKIYRIKITARDLDTFAKDKAATFKVGDVKVQIQLDDDVVIMMGEPIAITTKREEMN